MTGKKTKSTSSPRHPSPGARKQYSDLYRAIYRVVKRIPRGKVASYGQIARVAGFERHARMVGYALHALRSGNPEEIPWQRVINAKGYISLKDHEGGSIIQRKLLEQEGIEFSADDRVDLKVFGWKK